MGIDYLLLKNIFPLKDCDAPDNTECEGINLNLYDKSEDFCSCCRSKCVKFLKKGDPCSMDVTSVPDEMCGPQLGTLIN